MLEVLKNVIMENPVVIKETKLDKQVLDRFKSGKMEIGVAEISLLAEIQAERTKLIEALEVLNALNSEKEDLQSLITKGNSGLTAKLIDTQKKIVKAEAEVKELEESLKMLENLKEEQIKYLEQSLYSQYMDSGELVGEFNSNAEALQLQYYSALYKAFETANKLRALEDEYKNSAEGAFRNALPYKSFAVTFPADSFINQVRNNFPQPTSHCSAWGVEHIKKFTKKFEGIEKNKNFILYK